VARIKYCFFSLIVGWLMNAQSELEEILNKLEFKQVESRDDRQRTVAEAISTYLKSHPVLLSLDLAAAVTGKRRAISNQTGYALCTPSGNRYIRFSHDFKIMKLGEFVEKFVQDASGAEVFLHSPENRGKQTVRSHGETYRIKKGGQYRTGINIFYKHESDVHKFLQGRLKLVKKAVHYEFTP